VRTRYGGPLRLVAAVFAMSLIATACGGGGGENTGGTGTQAGGKKGGKIVLAAEQWPECLSPITSCANASWLPWTAWQYVMPRLTQVDPNGNYTGSDLAPEFPTKENGGIKESPFTVTYKLDPKAVWEDGSPITSEDVKFTWQAILKTTGTLSTVGYDRIDSIDTSDPKTVVIKFKEPYASWADLFGSTSANGVVLKKAAFGGKTDLKDEMKNSYPFSGGPFKLQSYSKQQTVLVRNDKYWVADKIPNLDQVTFVPREEQSTEINAVLTGEAQAAYPQPSRGMTKRLKAPGVSFKSGPGATYEGLWFNHQRFPLNDKAVREAIGYAADRQAVIDGIFKADFPDLKLLNCAGWVPTVGKWCDNSQFADFTYNPDKAKQILQQAGWTLGGDGIFAKGGKKLSIEFATTAGNKNRQDTQALLKEKAKAAGIDLVLKTFPPTQLFQDKLPKLDYVMAEYAQVATPDPSVTSILGCDQIPSKANGFSGQNTLAWCNQEATKLMREADRTIDIPKREALTKQIGALERKDVAWIPLYQKPLILTWRSDRLTGPIGDYVQSSNSGFFNVYDWSLK
jgi:peptide/nickel transport system substrate-binding protein